MATINRKLFEQAEADFEHHIDLESNSRIIFSGPYGTGKTTFLKYFFAAREDEYNFIRLAPVNYSISSNEDIFKYIKYDILRELIESKRMTFDDFEISKLQSLPFFVETEYPSIFKSIVSGIVRVKLAMEGLRSVSKEFDKLNAKLTEYNQKLNEKPDKAAKLFMEAIQSEEGSLYENNTITEFINYGLENNHRENVLVIDDLDRIDPGHIFRLLNVLSAHIDWREEGNKFAFDKIILVCDINNIRNIFSTKYGARTDFNGYIDKFYSRRIHYFDNRQDLKNLLRALLKNLSFDTGKATTNSNIREALEEEMFLILSTFVIKGLCNLRSIFRFESFQFRTKKIFVTAGIVIETSRIISALVLELLLAIFGDRERLTEMLEQCINPAETNQMIHQNQIKHIVMLTKISKHKYIEQPFDINEFGMVLKYEVRDYGAAGTYWAQSTGNQIGGVTKELTNQWNHTFNLFNQYIEGLSILDKNGALN